MHLFWRKNNFAMIAKLYKYDYSFKLNLLMKND